MEQKEKNLGYKVGEIFAAVVVSCITILIIAATIKLILMLMF